MDVMCFVSSDCDFTPLVTRALAEGKVVLGFGERKTPAPFVRAYSKFLFLDRESKQNGTAQSKAKNQPDTTPGRTRMPHPTAPISGHIILRHGARISTAMFFEPDGGCHSNERITVMRIILWVLAITALFLTLQMAPAIAAEAKIGIFDMNMVLQDSIRGREFQTALQKLVKLTETQLKEEYEEIKSLNEALEKTALLTTDDQKAMVQEDLHNKIESLKEFKKDRQAELKKLERKATHTIVAEIKEVIRDYLTENELAAIIEKKGFYVSGESVDLTQVLIERYNRQTSKQP